MTKPAIATTGVDLCFKAPAIRNMYSARQLIHAINPPVQPGNPPRDQKWPTGPYPQARGLQIYSEADCPHRWSPIIGLVIVVAMSVGAWFFAPKGENQVYVPSILTSYTPFLGASYTGLPLTSSLVATSTDCGDHLSSSPLPAATSCGPSLSSRSCTPWSSRGDRICERRFYTN